MNRFGFAVISLILVLVAGTTSAAASAATVIKIATLVPASSNYGSKIKAAGIEINERTDGRVTLKVYYGGTQGQGDAATVKKMIKIGQLQGGDFTPTDFQDKMPDLNLYGLPFVFRSIEEVNYVRKHMDGLLAAGFADEGFVTFGFAGDFAIILSNTPVRGLGDLKGRKASQHSLQLHRSPRHQRLRLWFPFPLVVGCQTSLPSTPHSATRSRVV